MFQIYHEIILLIKTFSLIISKHHMDNPVKSQLQMDNFAIYSKSNYPKNIFYQLEYHKVVPLIKKYLLDKFKHHLDNPVKLQLQMVDNFQCQRDNLNSI